MKQFIWKYKFTILSVLFVLIAIMTPGDDIPSVGITIPHIDKVVHLGMFGGVSVCFYWDYVQSMKKMPSLLLSLIALVGFAAMTEIIQLYVPKRSCDYRDFIADSIGILLAIGISRQVIRKYFLDKQQ